MYVKWIKEDLKGLDTKIRKILKETLKRGWDEADIRKVIFRNVNWKTDTELRLLQQEISEILKKLLENAGTKVIRIYCRKGRIDECAVFCEAEGLIVCIAADLKYDHKSNSILLNSIGARVVSNIDQEYWLFFYWMFYRKTLNIPL